MSRKALDDIPAPMRAGAKRQLQQGMAHERTDTLEELWPHLSDQQRAFLIVMFDYSDLATAGQACGYQKKYIEGQTSPKSTSNFSRAIFIRDPSQETDLKLLALSEMSSLKKSVGGGIMGGESTKDIMERGKIIRDMAKVVKPTPKVPQPESSDDDNIIYLGEVQNAD